MKFEVLPDGKIYSPLPVHPTNALYSRNTSKFRFCALFDTKRTWQTVGSENLNKTLHYCSHSRSSFSDFAQKYGKEDRFKGIEKMRDREGLFNEYILEVRRREKDEKVQKKETVSKKGGAGIHPPHFQHPFIFLCSFLSIRLHSPSKYHNILRQFFIVQSQFE